MYLRIEQAHKPLNPLHIALYFSPSRELTLYPLVHRRRDRFQCPGLHTLCRTEEGPLPSTHPLCRLHNGHPDVGNRDCLLGRAVPCRDEPPGYARHRHLQLHFCRARHTWMALQFSQPPAFHRPPVTLAASTPCVVFSPGLRDDYDRIASYQDRTTQIEKLESLGRRYGLGFFRDGHGEEWVGVERLYSDQSQVDVTRRLL